MCAQWLELVFKLPLFQSFFYRNTIECDTSCIGKRARVHFGSRKLTGFIIGEYDSLPDTCPYSEQNIKPIDKCIDAEPFFGKEQVELARWLAHFYICPIGQALAVILPSAKREAVYTEAADFSSDEVSHKELTLSDEQYYAVHTIVQAQESQFFYVYGITGSGKTEVFLQAAAQIMQKGKSVLYLVPEIALSHQVAETVQTRFGSRCAILHSGLTEHKRFSEWMRIKRKEATIIIGVRSAVFAPIQDIGLIIIDEEHDGSYKSGFTPRYHARQVAMHLSKQHTCPLVMGSATPSVEAWYMMKKGIFHTLPLTKRLSGGALPAITIKSLLETPNALTDALIDELRHTKSLGKQSILFLNRRGFSHFFKCRQCGHELLCKNCSVPLTFHKSEGILKCHYCGWRSTPPQACPECGSLEAGYTNIGTEYIEEQVRKTFPDCTIARIDTDVLQKNKQAAQILSDFRQGRTDILLGTQMIAKGLNFPGVRLTGIVLADTGLQMPDFRAAERTFALIMQVAGRAGRCIPDGKVIIQTYNPLHPAILCAQNNMVTEFYTYELEQRKALSFPPFTRLIRLVFRSKNSKKVEKAVYGAFSILRTLLCRYIKHDTQIIDILGPSDCMLALIAGNYRMQLLLRSKEFITMQTIVRHFIAEYKPYTGVYIEIDIDPVSLL